MVLAAGCRKQDVHNVLLPSCRQSALAVGKPRVYPAADAESGVQVGKGSGASDIRLAGWPRLAYRKARATPRVELQTVTCTESNPTRVPVLARVCENCPFCRRARRKQRGLAFWLVRKVEGKICRFGRAYERAFGRKPHEPV
jgi:hypothetical protein